MTTQSVTPVSTGARRLDLDVFPSNLEIAQKSGLDTSTVSRIFRGERNVTMNTGPRLMKALGITSWDELMRVIEARREAALAVA